MQQAGLGLMYFPRFNIVTNNWDLSGKPPYEKWLQVLKNRQKSAEKAKKAKIAKIAKKGKGKGKREIDEDDSMEDEIDDKDSDGDNDNSDDIAMRELDKQYLNEKITITLNKNNNDKGILNIY